MKLVLAIGNLTEPLVYFANAIHEKFPVDLLIVENKPQSVQTQPVIQRQQVNVIEKTLKYVLFRLENRRIAQQSSAQRLQDQRSYQKWFKNLGKELNPGIPVLEVSDINSVETERAIKECHPDMFLDHGTSLVKPNILGIAKVSLNLHWGLSPYYRGVNCTERALLNWDSNNIGVTIHRLGEFIDGGDILGQKRAVITTEDSIEGINAQLTHLGTEIMLQAIQKVKNGEELIFRAQQFHQGFLVKGMYWNKHISNFLNEIDPDMLGKMLKYPSRPKAPIIELN